MHIFKGPIDNSYEGGEHPENTNLSENNAEAGGDYTPKKSKHPILYHTTTFYEALPCVFAVSQFNSKFDKFNLTVPFTMKNPQASLQTDAKRHQEFLKRSGVILKIMIYIL